MDMPDLSGKTIAFLVATEGTEQIELTTPRDAMERNGATTQLVSTQAGEIQAFNHLDKGDTFPVDAVVSDVAADDFDALVLPGGVANPDNLRMHDDAVAFVKGFFDAGKPVAAICHAAWTLIEAGVVADRQLTSWPSLQTDLRNAGAMWTDQEVVVCSDGPNVLVTSRKPDDLEAFVTHAIDRFAAA
jgi:protease I